MTLFDQLPPGYKHSDEVRAIQEALQPEIDALKRHRLELFDQLDISKATWGLAWWERRLGLPVAVERDNAYRRGRIYAKLRGQGPATVARVLATVQSMTALRVELREEPPGEDKFTLRYIGTSYAPETLDGIDKALREVVPAHVAWEHALVAEAGQEPVHVGFVVRVGRRMRFTMRERRD